VRCDVATAGDRDQCLRAAREEKATGAAKLAAT
jgi:hypothetical protein